MYAYLVCVLPVGIAKHGQPEGVAIESYVLSLNLAANAKFRFILLFTNSMDSSAGPGVRI